MRGIERSRLVTARVFLAGALIAGALVCPVHARPDQAPPPDQTALAMPRIRLPAGDSALGLPQPLPPDDAARIRRIFAWQRTGQIRRAAAETAQLSDTTLLGDILADRLLRQPRVSVPALTDWLTRYADLPDAGAIYARLLAHLPPGAKRPPAPVTAALGSADVTDGADAAGPAREAFAAGHDAAALRLATAAWRRSHGADGQAAFTAGLAAWREGNFDLAGTFFEAASLSPQAGAGLRAAGAYWAARAHLRDGHPDRWRAWMQRAAADPATLHGRLARHVLGIAVPTPVRLVLGEADLEAVAETPQGRRAFALLQVGEPARAEAELRSLWPHVAGNPALARAVLLVARNAGMDRLATDAASALGTDPPVKLPRLRPAGGFTLSPALIYAVARVESNFDPHANSEAGAQGLMQLRSEAIAALGHAAKVNLSDPGTNLKFGQRYLAYLSRDAAVGDDLLRVLAAYNAGPGAVARWKLPEDDPLLFIEAIPVGETRRYVQATLTYLWRYDARMGLESPSLEAIADGDRPRFSDELGGQGPRMVGFIRTE